MLIFILAVATVLLISWLLLFGKVTREDWICAAYNKVVDNYATMDKLRQKDKQLHEMRSRYSGIASVGISAILGRDIGKKLKGLERDSESLKNGQLTSINPFAMPGYVLQRKFDAIGRGGVHKSIMSKNYELCGKKYASFKTKHLLARLLSYPLIGISLTLMLGATLIGLGHETIGMAIVGVGAILVLVLTYALYDELIDQVRKRRNAISRQFPSVVSKLALLVTSGMIMDRAWKETAWSQESQLYREMRKTSEELDNLVSPEQAFGDFIKRCNTKETAKLASAITLNRSKGNAEIGALLKEMAREAWLERRHCAKREAERANSRLMIPTMLLFIAILIMLMVPVAMNFSSI